MKLSIKNFAKILEADIDIDGITIIAGNNNTGKSTVGKVLDSVFNASRNIDEKMKNARLDSLAYNLRREIENNRADMNTRLRHYSMEFYHELADELLIADAGKLKEICIEYQNRMNLQNEADFVERIKQYLEMNKKISDKEFCKKIYTNYFNEVFHEDINSLYESEKPAEIKLTIKDKDIKLKFEQHECSQEERQIELHNNSIYIDDPFIIDEMNNDFTFGILELPIHKRNILQKLMQKEEKSVEEKAFSDLLIDNKLQDIMKIINRVVVGKVAKKQKYMYLLDENDSSKDIDVASLSTGLKAFVILKQLLINGNVQDKDVIVLDEPEIHLHPEWQLLYAEIIVLLQRQFNFHIIVTTHSAHFLEALELYSLKYNISDRCNYYMSTLKDNGAVFENVSDNISKIYKQMVDPTLLLSQLREELETEDD
ncbi:MAG: ATP-binding protein [Lachnospira sp.]|nr:ATP-binding protein [Lachnospira sp.]